MTTLYLVLVGVLMGNIAIGLIRILRGPTVADRMLAAEFFGTVTVAIILLLAIAMDKSVYYDVALVFALLSALAVVAFVTRGWPDRKSGEQEDERG
ncbi:monovalent cation/H+ antiporter complex subunit F [Desulfobulbus alkaliphilus]|uniref:monovalent cation/H+ antiporter complex subunit F n=1 Tax=Desulfobulbus alkaliphilus TaxID=869814 RepID=UPI0019648489|nr:monovalent cation/H+ antiporter complex subunit F [Desulfobulbus alkaliphilus]MBM9537120.1 multiple resistance and pH regulation protein F [Desulfobulbus alkaliphilus]